MCMFVRGLKIKFSIGLLVLAIVFVLLSFRTDAASPASIISYQGKILQNGASVSSSLVMNFKLFNTSTLGTELYSNTSTVIVSSGLFSVLLGDDGTTALDPTIFRDNSDLYLQVTVGTETLSPRKRLVTSPYAFNAKYLDGYAPSITPTNTNYIPVADGNGGFTFNNVTTTGDVSASGSVKTNQFCDANGNNCFDPSIDGWGVTAKHMRTSTASYNGSFTTGTLHGYVAADNICRSQYSGYHFCTTEDIIKMVYGGNNISNFVGTAWVANGPPGYTANSNDCVGWTTSSSVSLGAFWLFENTAGGAGWLVNCSVTKPIACCK
jgi:hypothetical protein